MSEPDLTKFRQKLAERRAQREAEEAKKVTPQLSNIEEDLIPEADYDRTQTDIDLDNAIDSISVIDAYNRWCGKMTPIVRGDQREGIKISCPIPGHIDSDPSAWINLDKQTWFCGGCQEGGDKFDIAAYYTGFPVPGYKDGAEFHKLRERMASDFGYTVVPEVGGGSRVVSPIEENDKPGPSADIVELYNDNEDDDDEEDESAAYLPTLDWRPVCPPQTFLGTYMEQTTPDDVPEEYHFAHALLAIGLAIGKDVMLFDRKPIVGNLFICTLGRTGAGKSRALSYLDDLIQRALPYDYHSVPSKGAKKVSAPGSGEHLVAQFMEPVTDPTEPKKIAYYAPVRGLVDFNELAALVARSGRTGSTLTTHLQEMYDALPRVATGSMTSGAKIAIHPFASAITTSQPKALKKLLTKGDVDNGFLNRWVFINGTEKQRVAIGGAVIDVRPAIEPLQNIQGWSAIFRKDSILNWSEKAVIEYTRFFHDTLEVDRKEAEKNGNADVVARLDLTIKKLVLLFAANRMEDEASEQSVRDAIYCYEYLKACYSIPWGAINSNEYNDMVTDIEYQIKRLEAKTGKGVTIKQLTDLLRRKYQQDKIEKAIDNLVKYGLVEMQTTKQKGPGRPTRRFKYVG